MGSYKLMYTRQRTTVALELLSEQRSSFSQSGALLQPSMDESEFLTPCQQQHTSRHSPVLLEAALLAAVILTERLFQLLDYAAPSFSSSTMTWLQNGS